MKEYIQRYQAYFEKAHIKSTVVDGFLWREYKRMIIPVGSVSEEFNLSDKGVKQLFKTFPAALLCRWTTPSDCKTIIPKFYAVVCTSFTPTETLKSKQRSEINRGLTNCSAKIVRPQDIIIEAYNVYKETVVKYGEKAVEQNIFSKDFMIHEGFDDIIHYWGVFNESKLIAYAKVYIYDNEANVAVAKFSPAFLDLYPSYSLFYKLNEFYLKEHNFAFVNDGFRNLSHDTKIQEFLIKKFNYERYPLILYIKFKHPWGLLLKVSKPFKCILKKINPKFKAIISLSDIAIEV